MNKFKGFESSKQNWSKLPHQLIEALPNIKTIGEMKVIIYTLRHTWGYQDDYKKITLDEFENGRKRKDGSRIDNGTGLTKPTIVDGIKRAVADGFLFEHVDLSDTARIEKFYSLTQEGLKDLTPGVKTFNTRGKDSLHRTEKETIKKETLENGSAKNSQNRSRAADDNESFVDIEVPCPYCGRVQCDTYKCGRRPGTLTQNEKDDLNILAAHIAKATNTNANDEDSKDRLRAATLLGYEIAKICELIISIIAHADQRMMEQLVKVAISLYQNNVSVGDLEKFKIWWYDNTWQGKKGQTPSPAQIASYWGQFEAAQSTPASTATGPTLSDEAMENYKRLLAQQTK